MPTRPSQNDPQRVVEWERLRQMVGQNIRDARTEQGMSQETLSLLSGVTWNVLIDVEHGRRGLLYERIYDLAKALQVPIDRLLGEQ